MIKTISWRRGRRSGFTLIELLVVIAIIGLLAAIVLASLNTARRKSRDARRVADIKQLQLALELYFDSNPATGYPGALATLANAALNPCGPGTACIPAVPTDPQNQLAYTYTSCGVTAYHLAAGLEESSNPALNSDRDAPINTVCPTDAINGADAAQGQSCTGTGTRYCYDVSP